MKIKRIKKILINATEFKVLWNSKSSGGSFDYYNREIIIGVKRLTQLQILNIITHELMEVCAAEMHVRLSRSDCDSDYIFVYDHRQHTTMMEMFAGLLGQFL